MDTNKNNQNTGSHTTDADKKREQEKSTTGKATHENKGAEGAREESDNK